jgi:hypothetical protein
VSEEFDLKFRISVGGKDSLDEFFTKSERQAASLQSTMGRTFRAIGSSISSVAGKAEGMFQGFAGKELGGSIASNARGVLQLRDAITQLAVSSGKGGEIVGALKDQIQKTALASNQLQGDVTAALQAFVERTGDLDTARLNLELYSKTATATGAALSDVAQIGVDLKEKLNITDQAKSFAILAAMAKSGAIELKDVAKIGPRLFSVAESAGVTDEGGLREIGALAQVYAKGVGGSGSDRAARVATAVENTFAGIAKKAAKLEAAGIPVQGRDRFDVLFDVIKKTGGDETKLREVFSQQAMRGVLVLANEFKRTGGFASFEGFRRTAPDAQMLARDFATRSGTGEAAIRNAQNKREVFFDKYLGGVAEFAAKNVTGIGLGVNALSGVGSLMSFAGRAGGLLGGRAGGIISGAAATPVRVVNWPGGFGTGGTTPGAVSAVGTDGKVGKVLAATGVGLAAYEATRLLDDATGGRISGGTASAMGALSGQSGSLSGIEGAGAELHRLRLERRKAERASLIRDFEGQGLSHGKAIYAADQKMQATVENLTVVINGDEASVEGDTGTRSPKVMVRRSAGEN